jgi:hypothetical protein
MSKATDILREAVQDPDNFTDTGKEGPLRLPSKVPVGQAARFSREVAR